MSSSEGGGGGNGSQGLAKLLNQLNLPTLALILLLQGSNLWETKSGNNFNAAEMDRAIREVHQLYEKLMDYEKRQTITMESNTQQLRNQGEMLDNQRKVLDILQTQQRRFFGGGVEHP